MAIVSEQRSALNPHAPPFMPAAYRQVEDFSPEWWHLVKNSAWFRDYWLSQHGEDDFCGDAYEVEFDDESVDGIENSMCGIEGGNEKEEGHLNGVEKDVKALMKVLRVPEPEKCRVEHPKYPEKPPQRLSPRCAPRRIHQPR